MIIAAINNLTDHKTNQYLIYEMVSMRKLKEEQLPLAKGILWRAWNNKKIVKPMLLLIASYQLIIGVLLITSAVLIAYTKISAASEAEFAINFANYALSLFCLLWLFFLCGGLWFAYWIKMFSAQTAHFTLLIVGLISLVFINMPTVV
jgi:predicted small integral membrane protein